MHDGALHELVVGAALAEGRLCGFSAQGHPVVETAQGLAFEAHSLIALGPSDIGAEVAFGRLGGADGTPLILGRLQPPITTVADDRDVQVIEARERLVLRCGPASVTLFADGRVEIRGTQLLSRSEGANRIQGGSVHLN